MSNRRCCTRIIYEVWTIVRDRPADFGQIHVTVQNCERSSAGRLCWIASNKSLRVDVGWRFWEFWILGCWWNFTYRQKGQERAGPVTYRCTGSGEKDDGGGVFRELLRGGRSIFTVFCLRALCKHIMYPQGKRPCARLLSELAASAHVQILPMECA